MVTLLLIGYTPTDMFELDIFSESCMTSSLIRRWEVLPLVSMEMPADFQRVHSASNLLS